jgi:hypothetical protein
MLVDAAHNPASRHAGRLGFVPPLLPTLASAPPSGDGWLHEIKHDGFGRCATTIKRIAHRQEKASEAPTLSDLAIDDGRAAHTQGRHQASVFCQ